MSRSISRSASTTLARVLLVGPAIALQARLDRLAEGPVERGGILRGIREDHGVGEALAVERLADDGDLAVHHPGGGDDVGARAGLRDGHRGIQLIGGVVVDPAVIVEHAAVAVVGELVEAGVGHDHEVVADRVAHRAQRDVEDAVRVDRAAAGRVLVALAGHAEEHDAAETRVDAAPSDVDDARQGVVLHARHRRDRRRGIDPVGDEDGQHELARGAASSRRRARAAPGSAAAGGGARSP